MGGTSATSVVHAATLGLRELRVFGDFAGRGLRRETHGTPSAEIQASIGKLLGRGAVDDPQKMLSELARLGARLIMQLAVFGVVGREDEQIE